MINDVIHQIIDLDKRAVQIKESAAARAEKIVSDTKDHLKEEETKVITQTRETGKVNYDAEIQKAHEEKDSIIEEMTRNIAAVREQYENAKAESAKQVLDELFHSIKA